MDTNIWLIILVLVAGMLGLLSHAAKDGSWLQWFLRHVIAIVFILEGKVFSTVFLFIQARHFLSWFFTVLNLIVTGQILLPLIRKDIKASEYFRRKKIFLPYSFPHLMALFLYISAAYLLLNKTYIHWSGKEQLWTYNGVALIILSFCGIGLFVSRSWRQALSRLDLVKPSVLQLGVVSFLIFAGFLFDYLWAMYMHRLEGQDLATQLSYYNSSTFTVAGSFLPSVVFALVNAAVAGVGEETLFRGALQPVFGILPSALLHGMLHGYLSHSPIMLVKVAIWSVFMGLIRRYTNTTTVAIGHAIFNCVTIILFAMNP